SALVKVYKSGKFQGIMKPEKRFYKREQPTTEVAIKDSLFQDLYLILSGWENDGSVTLTVVINPFLSWAWVGTGVIVLGTIWAVIPRRRKEWETELLEKDLILYLKGVKGL
ncbi:MAG TPA: hypothetical protein ENG80_04440, partial [Nitrospirae bacterium]|nr:hypothetical protein [Nitrospirota bacterium]